MSVFNERGCGLSRVARGPLPAFWPRWEHAFGIFRMKKQEKPWALGIMTFKNTELLGRVVLPGSAGRLLFEGIVCVCFSFKVKLGSWGGHSTLRAQQRKTASRRTSIAESQDCFKRTAELPQKYKDGYFEIPYT